MDFSLLQKHDAGALRFDYLSSCNKDDRVNLKAALEDLKEARKQIVRILPHNHDGIRASQTKILELEARTATIQEAIRVRGEEINTLALKGKGSKGSESDSDNSDDMTGQQTETRADGRSKGKKKQGGGKRGRGGGHERGGRRGRGGVGGEPVRVVESEANSEGEPDPDVTPVGKRFV